MKTFFSRMFLLCCALLGPAPAARSQTLYQKPPKQVLDVLHAAGLPRRVRQPDARRHDPRHARELSLDRLSRGAHVAAGGRADHPCARGGGKTPAIGAPLPSLRCLAAASAASASLRASGSARPSGARMASVSPSIISAELGRVVGGRCGWGHEPPNRGRAPQPIPGPAYTVAARPEDALGSGSPRGPGAPPAQDASPRGPAIQQTSGQRGASSTYELRDVLKNPKDEELFDYFAATQLALVDTQSDRITPLGKPGPLRRGCAFAGRQPPADNHHPPALLLCDRLLPLPRVRSTSGTYPASPSTTWPPCLRPTACPSGACHGAARFPMAGERPGHLGVERGS